MDLAEELVKLARVRDQGLLSAEEFEAQRRALISRSLSSVPPTGSAVPPASSALIASLGAYDLIELIGEGGMGLVYRARHRVLAMASRQGGDVAVKILHPHLVSKPGLVERFRREAEALATLGHANVVSVLDLVEEGSRIGLAYVVEVRQLMEGAKTRKLATRVKADLEGRRTKGSEIARLLEARAFEVESLIRETRNEDGHPTGIQVDRDGAFVMLRLLPRQLKLNCDLGIWLRAQPAGGAP